MKIGYTLLVLATLFIAACTKKTDIAPNDPAAQVAGDYELTTLRYDSGGVIVYNHKLPMKNDSGVLSGIITARRDSATVVFTTYTLRQTGHDDVVDTFGQLTLRGTASPYDIYYDTIKVGTTDGKNFTIDYAYTDLGVTYRKIYAGQKK